MAEYEEKFIVINKKRFEELSRSQRGEWAVSRFKSELELFLREYRADTGKPLNQKYYVVNQDEPYADNVIKFILDNETKQEANGGD